MGPMRADDRTPRGTGPKGSRARRASGAVAFDSALGRCVLAWTPRGVRELHLPDPAEALRPGRLAPGGAPAKRGAPAPAPTGAAFVPVPDVAAAPPWVRRLVRRVQGHLAGDLDGFQDVALDYPEDASDFDRLIWETARQVPPGLTLSYGELAEEAGRPGAARAVGSAMRRCPVGLLVPAHRVVGAGRRPGGWTGAGGVATKLRLLAVEGVDLRAPRGRRR